MNSNNNKILLKNRPFGMAMGNRKFNQINKNYRYNFNGKEQDKETSLTSTYDYGFRIYNPALGRFLSVDPLTQSYPWNSTYAFAENDVIRSIDLDGLEKYIVIYDEKNPLKKTVTGNGRTLTVLTPVTKIKVIIQVDKSNQLINQQLKDAETGELLAPKNKTYNVNNLNETASESATSKFETFIVSNSIAPKSATTTKGNKLELTDFEDENKIKSQTRGIEDGEQLKQYEAVKTGSSIFNVSKAQSGTIVENFKMTIQDIYETTGGNEKNTKIGVFVSVDVKQISKMNKAIKELQTKYKNLVVTIATPEKRTNTNTASINLIGIKN